jgi:activating signal cointegrator 1
MNNILRALTTWQPYCSLLVYGIKKYETRGWCTSYRGPVALHSAKKPIPTVMAMLPAVIVCQIRYRLRPFPIDQLPVGYILGYGNLVACHKIDDQFIASLSQDEKDFGDFTPGRYAWEFRDIVQLDRPVKMRGSQGLWTVHEPEQVLNGA